MENLPYPPFSLPLFAFALISLILRLPAKDEKKLYFSISFVLYCK